MRTASEVLHIVTFIVNVIFIVFGLPIYDLVRAYQETPNYFFDQYEGIIMLVSLVGLISLFILSLLLEYEHPVASAIVRIIQFQPTYIVSGILLICSLDVEAYNRMKKETKYQIVQENDYFASLNNAKASLASGTITEEDFDDIVKNLRVEVAAAEKSLSSRMESAKIRLQKGVINIEEYEKELTALNNEMDSIKAFRSGKPKKESINLNTNDKDLSVAIVDFIPRMEEMIEQKGFNNKNYNDVKGFYEKGIYERDEYANKIFNILKSNLSELEQLELFHDMGIYSDKNYELKKKILTSNIF